jgi:hypothetical protein
MSSNNKEDEQHGPGIRFGADVSNAYAGEVGYDNGTLEYDTELGAENETEEDDDQGRMQASHPSTLQRQKVRFYFPSSKSEQQTTYKEWI